MRSSYFLKKSFVAIINLFCLTSAFSQQKVDRAIIRFTSNYTSFPDSARAHGHVYDSVEYSTSEHYNDNSVLLIAPRKLDKQNNIALVFWFHGWHNNIDTALQFYGIERQFLESNKNAVLVLAETAKNAPDSYGGRLEQNGDFKLLVSDVLNKLKEQKIINKKAASGKITLAGHSGAYRVIAYMLMNGQVPVSDVYLFDALYGQTDKFLSWMQQDNTHHFVNWYTNHGGGTDEVSIEMMHQLDSLRVPYVLVEESSITPTTIQTNRIVFVHSAREHNVIINSPDNLKLLLSTRK